MSDLVDRLAGQLTDSELTRLIELHQWMTTPPATTPVIIPPVQSGIIRVPNVRHEYSTFSPWNNDNAVMVLLHDSGTVWLHFGDGRPYQQLTQVNHSSEIRWSRSERTIFYFIDGYKLCRFDVSKSADKAVTVVCKFSDYDHISGLGESDLSPGGNSIVLIGDDRGIFTYQLDTGRQSKILKWTQSLDSLYLTNTRVLVSSPGNGIYMFDHDMNPLPVARGNLIVPSSGHMDVCLDDGEEYLVWTNSADSTGPNKNAALSDCRNGIVRVRLSTGAQTCLLADNALQGQYAYSVHVSGVDNKGWVIAETYKSNLPTHMTANANKIFKLYLDGSKSEIIQDLGLGPFDTYTLQPKTALSMDGSRLIYDLAPDSYIKLL